MAWPALKFEETVINYFLSTRIEFQIGTEKEICFLNTNEQIGKKKRIQIRILELRLSVEGTQKATSACLLQRQCKNDYNFFFNVSTEPMGGYLFY